MGRKGEGGAKAMITVSANCCLRENENIVEYYSKMQSRSPLPWPGEWGGVCAPLGQWEGDCQGEERRDCISETVCTTPYRTPEGASSTSQPFLAH